MKHVLTAGAIALAAALVPTGAVAQSAGACTVIESLPATIGTPGNYCLAANAMLNMTSGAAITIDADHVTVDCRDFTIFNEASSDTGSSIGIHAVSQFNLLVRNCRVVGGFTDGIHLSMPMQALNSAFYNRIEDNYVVGPYRYGIVGTGSAIEVRGNTVYDVGGQATGPAIGIRVGGAAQTSNKFQIVEDNLVAGTTSFSNNGFAVFSDGSIGSVFRGNTLTGTRGVEPNYRGTGIRVATGTANTVRDNHILGRGQSNEIGIQLPANGGLCFDNRIGVSLTSTIGCDTSYGNY